MINPVFEFSALEGDANSLSQNCRHKITRESALYLSEQLRKYNFVLNRGWVIKAAG